MKITFPRLSLKFSVPAFIVLFMLIGSTTGQQIDIPRIEEMVNQPSPYLMRDWKQVALDYDALVFDLEATGEYLPLIWMEAAGINYPNHSRFGLHTVVGTPYPRSGEAINVLAAVVGASLVGIDKSDQNGNDWVLMCEDFFNKRPAENVYLNGPVTSSGSDWWYDTMPNVFFYQLFDLYPHKGDFDYQFRMVADRWLEAVGAMGGSTTPWKRPNMDYRAWSLSSMTPLDSGVRQPEAAGAIAWLLYHCFVQTGEIQYRIGSEWAMEFLDSRSTNPSYELQLPYGVYTAARMNAELGTTYLVEKLLNWCFTPEGNVRRWGSTLGNWGGYDCDGLIGEANGSGYAFLMNLLEQVGALVPMVRYDDRFARAIGKWVLNAANAARLFYSGFLPDANQDNETWARQYDPNSCIGYEALREYALGSGVSPYATGDAMRGGWGATNLALYGSSHVGILGGIIETTHVEMILKLDVLKTDYFHDRALPTYLYYNPYDESTEVEIDVGEGQHDLYDAAGNRMLRTGVTGTTSFSIPADDAVLVVIIPAGRLFSYDLDRAMIDSVIIDFHAGVFAGNYPPRIKSLTSKTGQVAWNGSTTVYCTASDRDDADLDYTWEADGGSFDGTGASTVWKAPDVSGSYTITCIVADAQNAGDTMQVVVEVIERENRSPSIRYMKADPGNIDLGASSVLTCEATDADGDVLSFGWTSEAGTLNGEGSSVTWTGPMMPGIYTIRCTVEDGYGGQARDSVIVIVQDFAHIGTGLPVAYYPLDGDATDFSGFGNHGIVLGSQSVQDRFGQDNHAFAFDGVNDYIRVPSHPSLDFQHAISVSFWMKGDQFFSDRESYPISHGNWESRWKISIIPGRQVRWTVKTDAGIKDLDTDVQLLEDVYYHIATLYDGQRFEIYVNGQLDASSIWSGLILKTPIDLTIGQVLPNNPAYNFKGVLDDIRIYNYALSMDEIQNLYHETTRVGDPRIEALPESSRLYQNYPNPFNGQTVIPYQIHLRAHVIITLYNMRGQVVRVLVDQEKEAGVYEVRWDGKNTSGRGLASGLYYCELVVNDYREMKKLLLLN